MSRRAVHMDSVCKQLFQLEIPVEHGILPRPGPVEIRRHDRARAVRSAKKALEIIRGCVVEMRVKTPRAVLRKAPFAIEAEPQIQICRRVSPLHDAVRKLKFERRVNHLARNVVPVQASKMGILRLKRPRESGS